MRSRLLRLTAAGAISLTLAACAGDPAAVPPDTSNQGPAAGGQGVVADAAETAEPPLGLTTIDAAGTVTHLDLLDESVSDLGTVGAPTAVTTDGRYLFAQTKAGIEIVDSGAWTWDHGDHSHYYRSDPRLLGPLEGDGPAVVATTNLSSTGGTGVFFADSGDAVLLDTEALSEGELVERFRLHTSPHNGMVVPIGSFALVTRAENGATASVAAYTSDGEPTGLEEPCVDAAGTIATRVGAVIGCRDGALLATVQQRELTLERIPYPAGTTAAAATAFTNREGRPAVASLADTDGVWLLDTRERSWTLLPAPAPLVGVTAVDDDDEHVLALAADGRMLVLNGEDGAILAETAPLVADSIAAGHVPALIADQQRAYLSGPVERRLYEIDFVDNARIARAFDTVGSPTFTAETGR
ncbi:MAG TPA: ABC transporter [Microbacterium sp.]|nr:ABC transporter [Microbacterium sp.]